MIDPDTMTEDELSEPPCSLNGLWFCAKCQASNYRKHPRCHYCGRHWSKVQESVLDYQIRKSRERQVFVRGVSVERRIKKNPLCNAAIELADDADNVPNIY